jgi:hypothetical protein
MALGSASARPLKHFAFAACGKSDLFHLSIQNNTDLMIADTASIKIRSFLRAWHRDLILEAQSFLVLLLVVGEASCGYIYADRPTKAPEGLATNTIALIRTIKGLLPMVIRKS